MLIHKRYAEGIVVGGTSGSCRDARNNDRGRVSETHQVEVVEMGPGMAFLPGVVIDQHFAQRGRLGRLLSALTQQPVVLGFGIDENTSVVVNGSEFEVGRRYYRYRCGGHYP